MISIIDCGVTSARRASCAFESPGRAASTASVVYSWTLSENAFNRVRISRRIPWLTRPTT